MIGNEKLYLLGPIFIFNRNFSDEEVNLIYYCSDNNGCFNFLFKSFNISNINHKISPENFEKFVKNYSDYNLFRKSLEDEENFNKISFKIEYNKFTEISESLILLLEPKYIFNSKSCSKCHIRNFESGSKNFSPNQSFILNKAPIPGKLHHSLLLPSQGFIYGEKDKISLQFFNQNRENSQNFFKIFIKSGFLTSLLNFIGKFQNQEYFNCTFDIIKAVFKKNSYLFFDEIEENDLIFLLINIFITKKQWIYENIFETLFYVCLKKFSEKKFLIISIKYFENLMVNLKLHKALEYKFIPFQFNFIIENLLNQENFFYLQNLEIIRKCKFINFCLEISLISNKNEEKMLKMLICVIESKNNGEMCFYDEGFWFAVDFLMSTFIKLYKKLGTKFSKMKDKVCKDNLIKENSTFHQKYLIYV